MENKLKGGKADNLTIKDIAKKFDISVKDVKSQIKKGKKVESEHTSDEEKQTEIAMDHVSEFPDYYDRIDKMEKAALKYWKEKETNESRVLIKKLLREELENLDEGFGKSLATAALGGALAFGGLGSKEAKAQDKPNKIEQTQMSAKWDELIKLLPSENHEPIDITQYVLAQGGKVPEKKTTMFWKNVKQNLYIELNKNTSTIDIKYNNDDEVNVSDIQKIFDNNGIRNTGLEFNGSDIEAGATISLNDVKKSANVINQIIKIMEVTDNSSNLNSVDEGKLANIAAGVGLAASSLFGGKDAMAQDKFKDKIENLGDKMTQLKTGAGEKLSQFKDDLKQTVSNIKDKGDLKNIGSRNYSFDEIKKEFEEESKKDDVQYGIGESQDHAFSWQKAFHNASTTYMKKKGLNTLKIGQVEIKHHTFQKQDGTYVTIALFRFEQR